MVNDWLKTSSELSFYVNEQLFGISALSGEGVEHLLASLKNFASQFISGSDPALITRERHRRTLLDAEAALQRALAPGVSAREDLFAEELRTAAQALGRLTGRVDVEDVLDVIFRDFCIGK
jgi:tRNA modification GTPase